jgi:hypothetical protein
MFLIHRIRSASKVAGLHLLGSLVVAALAAVVVFGIWFPYPYRELVGGRELFLLVVSVDVICGPLLTLVLFNTVKSRRELALDFGLVVCIQFAALGYGMYSVAQSRPVFLAFEVDRFRAVTAADVQIEQLKPERGGLQALSWSGPKLIGLREPKDSDEMLQSLELSLSGFDRAFRPDWWIPYDAVRAEVLSRAKSVGVLREKRPDRLVDIAAAIARSGRTEPSLRWLPVTSFQATDWVAFVDSSSGRIQAFAQIDGF